MILVKNKYKKIFEFIVVMCMLKNSIPLVLLLIFNKIINHFMQVNEKQTPNFCKSQKRRLVKI